MAQGIEEMRLIIISPYDNDYMKSLRTVLSSATQHTGFLQNSLEGREARALGSLCYSVKLTKKRSLRCMSK